VRVAGVIFNQVGSPRHEAMLRQVCDDLKVTCYGCLPKRQELEQESRYLGLDFSQDTGYQQLVELMKTHIEWEQLLKLS
jgi:cobyrinic acid a,c-diamide synthase